MVPYRYDPEHIAPANAAPRCRHIKLSGQRCGAPALRRRRFCHFHNRIIYPKRPDYDVRFLEDATSLQFAIMQVLHLLHGPNPDYKACGLSLYGLQIARSNLKDFIAEQPSLELPAAEQPQPQAAGAGKHAAKKAETKDEEPGLAEFLLELLATPDAPDGERPRIRSREDYYAAVARQRLPSQASPGEIAATG
jgi:hypothetical protein